MPVLPVVMRELSVAGRRPFTYNARFTTAALGFGAALFVFFLSTVQSSERGMVLLVSLTFISAILALLAGVFLTADSISEEKREGTLGLLFLTDLGGTDVVLGKLVAHSASAFAALLSLLPVFALPILTGGVTLNLTLRIMLALSLTLLLSLSLGLAVSAACRDSRKASLATLIGVIVVAGLPMVVGILYAEITKTRSIDIWIFKLSPVFSLVTAFRVGITNVGAIFWQSTAVIALECCVLLGVASHLARSTWKQRADAPARDALTERGRLAARRRRLALPPMRERLYEWLCRRRPSPALFRAFIGFLAVFWFAMLLIAISTKFWEMGFTTSFCIATLMHLMMKLEFALESSRQLHEDARHGGLELLLATPLSEHQILQGHARAYRHRFTGALALLTFINVGMQLAVIVFYEHLHMSGGAAWVFSTFFLGGILALHMDFHALAWIGAWRALRSQTHLKAALTSLAGIIGIPWLLGPPLLALGLNAPNETVGLTLTGSALFIFSAFLSLFLGRRARRLLSTQFRHQIGG